MSGQCSSQFPTLECFIDNLTSEEEMDLIVQWHKTRTDTSSTGYDFFQELIRFGECWTVILAESLISYLKASFKTQRDLYEHVKHEEPGAEDHNWPLFNCFSFPIVSNGSLTFTLLRYFAALHDKLVTVSWEEGR